MILGLSTIAVIDVVNDSVFYQTAGEGQALALRFCDYHGCVRNGDAGSPSLFVRFGSAV